jgi:hypothetical protein
VAAVELSRGADQLAEGASRTQSLDIHRPPAGEADEQADDERGQHKDGDRRRSRLVVEVDQVRDTGDGSTKGPGHLRARDRPARQPGAGRSLVRHPAERFAPDRLRRWAGRPVVVALLPLAPVPFVAKPLELAACRGLIGKEHRPQAHLPQRLARVVAAEARAVLTVLDVDRGVVERRVRPCGRVDDRPGAFLLHLRVVPAGALAAGVLEEDDLARFTCQRLLRGVGFEGELHPLPVALVEIVELVEVPEEPVLQSEAGVSGLAGDVGVSDRRRLTLLHQPREVLGVDAGIAQRVAMEVEVVVVA